MPCQSVRPFVRPSAVTLGFGSSSDKPFVAETLNFIGWLVYWFWGQLVKGQGYKYGSNITCKSGSAQYLANYVSHRL